MDIDEDDDFYGTEDTVAPAAAAAQASPDATNLPEAKVEHDEEDLEEGEEEDEGGAMDEDDSDDSVGQARACRVGLNSNLCPTPEYRHHYRADRWHIGCSSIVRLTHPINPTRRTLTSCVPRQSRYSNIKNIPQRSISTDTTVKAPPTKREGSTKASVPSGPSGPSGADYPAVRTSKVDVNAIPTHKGTGKPITQVNIDEGRCYVYT